MGGRGQERVIAARIAIAGCVRDLEVPLAYLAGAGVGAIEVYAPGQDRAAISALASDMRSLNPDSPMTTAAAPPSAQRDLALILIGDTKALRLAGALFDKAVARAIVLARLDTPGKLAVLPSGAPCPRCADRLLLAEVGSRAENSEFIAFAAVTETLKLIAGYVENPAPALLEFNGLEGRARRIEIHPQCACTCHAGDR
ncbi:MAG TPA: hypothetical protein VMT58_08960 [Candidatus Binataceae bacterium]|nr:hypothetical protein [Candidatus Binataceae bacterium]